MFDGIVEHEVVEREVAERHYFLKLLIFLFVSF